MMTFKQFLSEANAAGSKFEQKVADAVQDWIEKNGLQKKWKASRFQSVTEDEGSRDEYFSDVVVEDLESGWQFFIECKQNGADNIITTMFDIKEVDNGPDAKMREFYLVPVEGKSREEIPSGTGDPRNALAHDLVCNDDFGQFSEFISQPCELLGDACPADFLLGEAEVPDPMLSKLLNAYNKLVDDGKTESDCKKFDGKLIRESTRGTLAVALAWRLVDQTHTWDICKMEDFNIGDLIRNHYAEEKAIPAKYMQLGENGTYLLQDGDNPLGITCAALPDEVIGSFWLKFTPRFGTGSMYITPRSKTTGELPSTTSFLDEDNLPQLSK